MKIFKPVLFTILGLLCFAPQINAAGRSVSLYSGYVNNATGYNLYVADTYAELRYNYENHIRFIENHPYPAFCIPYDDSQAGFHFLVTAVNSAGENQYDWDVNPPTINQGRGFLLIGNIHNHFNDKTVDWDGAVIDMFDIQIFMIKFQQLAMAPNSVPSSGIPCGDQSLIGRPIPDQAHWCDPVRDNVINYSDYFFLMSRYNNPALKRLPQ